MCTRALEIARRTFGDAHSLVADLLHELAMIDKAEHRYAHAIERLEEARAIRVDVLGESHPEIGLTDRILAECHLRLGDLHHAESRGRSAVRIESAALGEDHPRVALGKKMLAEIERARAPARR
jgi:hypothetical protein